MESRRSISGYDKLIPGLPISGCPGPYWVAGELEILAEQSTVDILVSPFIGGDRILAILMEQSRPITVEGSQSSELTINEDDCVRVGEHLAYWPPGFFLREDPLRALSSKQIKLAQVGKLIKFRTVQKHPEITAALAAIIISKHQRFYLGVRSDKHKKRG